MEIFFHLLTFYLVELWTYAYGPAQKRQNIWLQSGWPGYIKLIACSPARPWDCAEMAQNPTSMQTSWRCQTLMKPSLCACRTTQKWQLAPSCAASSHHTDRDSKIPPPISLGKIGRNFGRWWHPWPCCPKTTPLPIRMPSVLFAKQTTLGIVS